MSAVLSPEKRMSPCKHGDDGSCNRPQPSSATCMSRAARDVKADGSCAFSTGPFIGWIWAGALMIAAGGLAAPLTSDIARPLAPLTGHGCVDCNPKRRSRMNKSRFLIPLGRSLPSPHSWRWASIVIQETALALGREGSAAVRAATGWRAVRDVSPKNMMGKVWLLNVWPHVALLREEHSLIMQIANKASPPWLVQSKGQGGRRRAMAPPHGNPYALSAFDPEGRDRYRYGVYGVPERLC